MKKLYLFIASAFVIAACSKDDLGQTDIVPVSPEIPEAESLAPQTVISASSQATKTALSGYDILWSAWDVISLFNADGAVCDYTLVGEGGATSGEFTTDASPSEGYRYAIYPKVAGPASGSTIAVELPASQTYASGDFTASYPMAAVSSDGKNFPFENLATILKISLVGDASVRSVAITAVGGEALAGAGSVDFSSGTPVLALGEGASSTVTLTCSEPVQLSAAATEFTMIVAPGTYSGGFSITVTDASDKVTTVTTAASETVLKAGTFKNFGGTMGVYAADFTNIYILGDATFYSPWSLEDMVNNQANSGDSPEWSSAFTTSGDGVWTWTGVLAVGEIKFPWRSSFNDFFGVTDVSAGKGKLVYHPDGTEGDQKYYVPQAGNYTITIDIHKLTFAIAANSLYEIPSDVYVIGKGTPGGWSQEGAVQMTKRTDLPFDGKDGEGVFYVEMHLDANSGSGDGFKFIFGRDTWDGIQFAWALNRIWQGGSDRKYDAISQAGTYAIKIDTKYWLSSVTLLSADSSADSSVAE